jgi:hypothetical protein
MTEDESSDSQQAEEYTGGVADQAALETTGRKSPAETSQPPDSQILLDAGYSIYQGRDRDYSVIVARCDPITVPKVAHEAEKMVTPTMNRPSSSTSPSAVRPASASRSKARTLTAVSSCVQLYGGLSRRS